MGRRHREQENTVRRRRAQRARESVLGIVCLPCSQCLCTAEDCGEIAVPVVCYEKLPRISHGYVLDGECVGALVSYGDKQCSCVAWSIRWPVGASIKVESGWWSRVGRRERG